MPRCLWQHILEQTAASIVFTEGTERALGEGSVTWLQPTPSGVDRAMREIRIHHDRQTQRNLPSHGSDDEGTDRLQILVLGGTMSNAQRILHELDEARIDAQVILVMLARLSPAEHLDTPGIIGRVAKQWGIRVLKKAQTVCRAGAVMELLIGREMRGARGSPNAGRRAQGNATLLVAHISIARLPSIRLARAVILVPNQEQAPDTIRIVDQVDLNNDVEAILGTHRQQHDQGSSGIPRPRQPRISVSPATIQPGRIVAHRPAGTTQIIIWQVAITAYDEQGAKDHETTTHIITQIMRDLDQLSWGEGQVGTLPYGALTTGKEPPSS